MELCEVWSGRKQEEMFADDLVNTNYWMRMEGAAALCSSAEGGGRAGHLPGPRSDERVRSRPAQLGASGDGGAVSRCSRQL